MSSPHIPEQRGASAGVVDGEICELGVLPGGDDFYRPGLSVSRDWNPPERDQVAVPVGSEPHRPPVRRQLSEERARALVRGQDRFLLRREVDEIQVVRAPALEPAQERPLPIAREIRKGAASLTLRHAPELTG